MDYLAATVDESVIEPRHLELILDPERLRRMTATELDPVIPADNGFRPLYDEIAELEQERVHAALEATQGNQTRAAALLAMPLRTFQSKVKQYGSRRRISINTRAMPAADDPSSTDAPRHERGSKKR